MNSRARVVVLCGGNSTESAVSKASGQAVFAALQPNYTRAELWDCTLNDLARRLVLAKPDVVFSTLHGGAGEDGTVHAALDLWGIRYVGSGVTASALAMNKHLAKTLFHAAGLPVLPDIVCGPDEDITEAARLAAEAFPEGVVVKAISQGSALGMSFCDSAEQIETGLRLAHSFGGAALIEKRFHGREITVAILEDPATRALPPCEIVLPVGRHFDYYARYTEGAATHICPAPLDEALRLRVEEIAVEAHRALGCRHYSRVDLLVRDNGDLALLELNTLPGMTKTSLYPEAATAASITFESLVQRLVEMALNGIQHPVSIIKTTTVSDFLKAPDVADVKHASPK